eukprot:GHVP01035405.1.p1 GENE.GHVP01035405.1~~GHVP01035405.1.p1  ORF type:complete len:367 (-),score=84.85 GHVP01035405.1:1307-2407(-)
MGRESAWFHGTLVGDGMLQAIDFLAQKFFSFEQDSMIFCIIRALATIPTLGGMTITKNKLKEKAVERIEHNREAQASLLMEEDVELKRETPMMQMLDEENAASILDESAKEKITPKMAKMGLVLGMIGAAGRLLVQSTALQTTSITNMALVQPASVLATFGARTAFGQDKIDGIRAAGFGSILAGTAIAGKVWDIKNFNAGSLLVLLDPILRALNFVGLDIAGQHYGSKSIQMASIFSQIGLVLPGAALGELGWERGKFKVIIEKIKNISVKGWLAGLASAVATAFGGWRSQVAMKNVGGTATSIHQALSVCYGMVADGVFNKELPSKFSAIGAAVVAAGLGVFTVGQKKADDSKEQEKETEMAKI